MKANQYHPVEDIEGEPLRRSVREHNDLLTQGQVLGFKVRSRSEQPDQQRLQQYLQAFHIGRQDHPMGRPSLTGGHLR